MNRNKIIKFRVTEKEEQEIIEEYKVEDHRYRDKRGYEYGKVLFCDSSRGKRAVWKKAAVQLVVLEIIGYPEPAKEAEYCEAADKFG